MMQVLIDGNKMLTLGDFSSAVQRHPSLLAGEIRNGRITGRKIAGAWFVDYKSAREYAKSHSLNFID